MNVLSNPNNPLQLSVHSPAGYQEFRLHFSSGNTAGLFCFQRESATMTKGDGKPCVRCGTSDWYDSGHCRECENRRKRESYAESPEKAIERSRRWATENPEKRRAISRRWKDKYPERHRENTRRWKARNPEKSREVDAQWRKRNPEKVRAYKQNRRARKTEAGGSYTAAEWKALKKQYNGRCACCGKKKKLTPDHVIPVSLGGTSDISNIQPLCLSCNTSKGNRHTTDYRTKSGIKRWIQDKLL